MEGFPKSLIRRLSPGEVEALVRLRDGIGETLVAVYLDEVEDHHEARGDDAQLFGFKLWKHFWFRTGQRFEIDPEIAVVKVDGSWQIRLGPLRIGAYKNGELEDQDAQVRHPDSSPTKRSYGVRNRDQLALFADEELVPEADAAAGALNDLTITHFGNPRDGFAKWYMGAEVREAGKVEWAWLLRQPEPAVAMTAVARDLIRSTAMPRFDEQPVADVPTPLRRLRSDAASENADE